MSKLLDTSFDGSSYETENDDSDISTEIPPNRSISLFGKEYDMRGPEITALVLLSLYSFLNYLYFSLLVPFYPGEAKSKGMSQTNVGTIFSIFQLVQLIFTPLFGKYIDKIGIKFLFVGGLFLSSTTEVLFGVLIYCPDGLPFYICCLLCRAVTAIGSSMGLSYAIIGYFFPKKVSTLVAILEVFSGFGLMLGPVIGGFLYQIGGFSLPFYVTGSLQFILFLLAWAFFPNVPTTEKRKDDQSYPFMPLFKIPKFVLTMLMLFSGALSINFVEPSIQLHLLPLKLSPVQLGFVFLVPALIYVLFTPIVGILCDKFPKTMPWFMIVSIMFSIVSYSLLGPLPWLNLPLKLWIFMTGYGLFSISFSGLIIPVYAEFIKIATNNGYPNDIRTQGLISGVFGSVYSLGALIGPISGGIVVDLIDFNTATLIVVLIFIVTGFLYTAFHIFESVLCSKINQKETISEILVNNETEPLLN